MKEVLLFAFFVGITYTAFGQDTDEKRIEALIQNADYDQAIGLADRSIATANASSAIRIENKKAEALIKQGKLPESESLLKSLLNQNITTQQQAITKTNLGLLYIYQGRNDLALQELQSAIQLFDQEGNSNSLDAAQAISYLGQVYKFTGKNAQAEEQLQMALNVRKNFLKDDDELIAGSYNDLGLVYALIDNDKALDYYEQKALPVYEKIHGKDHPKVANVHSNIGLVYRNLELYGDAVNNFETALAIWEKVYPNAHPSKAFVLYNLGQTYSKMGDQKAARGYYDRALKMYRETYGQKHPDIAAVLNDIGSLELSETHYDAAIENFQDALRANSKSFDDVNAINNPKLQDFYNGRVLLNSLLLKSRAFETRHFGKTLKLSDLTTSLAALEKGDLLIDKLRQQSSNESDKIALGAIATELYADGVRIAFEAATGSVKKRKFLEQSFYFAEKSKSAVLLEAISDSDAKSFAGIPKDLLEEEKSLKSSIALISQKLAQKPSAEEEKYLRETAFSLNRTYEEFVRSLEKEYPAYFNLKFNAASPSIGQLQALLDKNTIMLSYFIDELNSRLYIFMVGKKKFKIIDHSVAKDFDKNITGLRNGIYFNVASAFATAANRLSPLLLPHIPASTKNLVVIPTGRLGIVPFEALLKRKTKNRSSFDGNDYALDHYAIRYEFSAGLLLQKAKQSNEKKPSILLCAPVTFPAKDNLNELPATESEVKEISQLFASRNISTKLYTRQQASENEIKSARLKDYALLHFATHGVVDENNPELSRIFLQNNSESEDGNLFTGEIYNLEMDADLVTLSACQTGLGKISKGEGVIGLSRALVYAGAKNIIVSFWSVADESTSELMKTFYQRLLENPNSNYASSLREAKLALMKDEKYSAPFYWAPFILIGF